MSRFTRKNRPPGGYDYVAPVMEALEMELRERMSEPHEGKRKCESLWPVHQINWQRSRYIYDMYYKYKKIDRKVYDYCIKQKLIDANLIAKWKKPGYERLCSTYAINPKNFNYGTVSICRVPKHSLSEDQVVQSVHSGCRGCASGPGGFSNIFGNKYGQYLAAIQIAREKKLAGQKNAVDREKGEEADGEDEDDDDDDDDIEIGKKKENVWATEEEEKALEEGSEDGEKELEEEKEKESNQEPRAKKSRTE